MKNLGFLAVSILAAHACAWGQTAPEVSIVVEVDHWTFYLDDGGDPGLYGTVRERLAAPPATAFRPLRRYVVIADVVKVDEKPATGTFFAEGFVLTGNHGTDLTRNQIHNYVLEIMTPDRQQVGSLYGTFLGAGTSPPGTPAGFGVWSVLGGSGAFVGVQGHGSNIGGANLRPTRNTWFREDPTLRREFVGGQVRMGFNLVGTATPRVEAVYRAADFSLITPENPARSGDHLIVAVRAGWPVQPSLLAGDTFRSDDLQRVAIPIEVTVNNIDAPVINQVGWPGTRDRYRVDVHLPSGLAPGSATLEVTSGYIHGSPFSIAVR